VDAQSRAVVSTVNHVLADCIKVCESLRGPLPHFVAPSSSSPFLLFSSCPRYPFLFFSPSCYPARGSGIYERATRESSQRIAFAPQSVQRLVARVGLHEKESLTDVVLY